MNYNPIPWRRYTRRQRSNARKQEHKRRFMATQPHHFLCVAAPVGEEEYGWDCQVCDKRWDDIVWDTPDWHPETGEVLTYEHFVFVRSFHERPQKSLFSSAPDRHDVEVP